MINKKMTDFFIPTNSRSNTDYGKLTLNREHLDSLFCTPTTSLKNINYRKLFFALKKNNAKALEKLQRQTRRAEYWKKQHVQLVDALWKYTDIDKEDGKTLFVGYPAELVNNILDPPKTRSARSFTMPPSPPRENIIGSEKINTPRTIS